MTDPLAENPPSREPAPALQISDRFDAERWSGFSDSTRLLLASQLSEQCWQQQARIEQLEWEVEAKDTEWKLQEQLKDRAEARCETLHAQICALALYSSSASDISAKQAADTGGGCSICHATPAVNVEGAYWLCGPCVAERITVKDACLDQQVHDEWLKRLETAIGKELNEAGKPYGLFRGPGDPEKSGESDNSFRGRIREYVLAHQHFQRK